MAVKKTAEDVKIVLELDEIEVPIVGISPLIVSRFDEKSKRQIQEIGEAEKGLKQGGKKKNISSPEEDYKNSIYYFSDGKRTGIPAGAFAASMTTAGYRIFGKPQTVIRSAFSIIADDKSKNLVEIKGEHQIREDMVRVGTINKVASPRYRACYPEWSATLKIQYFSNILSASDIVNLVAAAGLACGVGEWRKEKCNSGSYGAFAISKGEFVLAK